MASAHAVIRAQPRSYNKSKVMAMQFSSLRNVSLLRRLHVAAGIIFYLMKTSFSFSILGILRLPFQVSQPKATVFNAFASLHLTLKLHQDKSSETSLIPTTLPLSLPWLEMLTHVLLVWDRER